MISWRNYRNQTDRVAATFIEAVRPWGKQLAAAEAYATPAKGVVTQQLIVRLARQVARQGLSPDDLDSREGLAALEAIASAILPTRKSGVDGIAGPHEIALQAGLPHEWKLVTNAAQRIIDRAVAGKAFEL